MKHERVLITVKTYPTLSASHIELVCTAGLREDGSWVRIYPIPFRLLDEASQFPKWTWVELPLVRRTKDKRPESFSPSDRENIKVQNVITTADNWRERRRLLFKKEPAWTNLSELIDKGKDNSLSLAVFKPKRLLGLEIEPAQGEWDEKKLAAVEAQLRQGDLLEANSVRENFKPANRVPYNFYYRFQDDTGRKSRLRILDWEIGMLYWKCRKGAKSDEEALDKVRQRYESEFFQKDLHLILGTTLEWHDRAPNPWVVIGVIPFPHEVQPDLFSDI